LRVSSEILIAPKSYAEGNLSGGAVMKTLSIFLALINSLLAGLLITCLISSVDFRISAMWWSVFRILVALAIVVIGVLTWIDGMAQISPGLLAISSLALVAIGAGTVVWTFQRALITGDLKYYMIVYGGSLFVQGIALLFGSSQVQSNASAA
jgi:hypothetical protein